MLAKFHWLDEVESTNREAQRLEAKACPEATVVVAKTQTGGRGRLGRSWTSPPGGLYWSMVLRPNFRTELFGWLSLAGGLSAVEVLREMTGNDGFQIKWPNDVLYQEHKVGGVLGEATLGMAGAAILLGIGLNLNQDPATLPERPIFPATTVLQALGKHLSPVEAARQLAARLLLWYEKLESHGPDPLRRRFVELSAHAGRWLDVLDGDQTWHGQDAGLSDQGALRLKAGKETLQFVSAQILKIHDSPIAQGFASHAARR